MPLNRRAGARDAEAAAARPTIAWAVFDAAWYLATYPDVRAELADAEAATVLGCYLDRGQSAGHSPNIFSTKHGTCKPTRAPRRRCARASAASGFDAYCRGGFQPRSPHWLFNEMLYRQRYPDLRDEVLAGGRQRQWLRPLSAAWQPGGSHRPSAVRSRGLSRAAGSEAERQAAASGPFHALSAPHRGAPARRSAHDAVFRSGLVPAAVSAVAEAIGNRRVALRAAPLSVQRHTVRIRSAAGILGELTTCALSRISPRRWRRGSGATATSISSAMARLEQRSPNRVDRPALVRRRMPRCAPILSRAGRATRSRIIWRSAAPAGLPPRRRPRNRLPSSRRTPVPPQG